jgi:hypothetical protein
VKDRIFEKLFVPLFVLTQNVVRLLNAVSSFRSEELIFITCSSFERTQLFEHFGIIVVSCFMPVRIRKRCSLEFIVRVF